MPVLEKYEVQQNRIWYRVDITEEQKEEYLKWNKSDTRGADEPEWFDELDWDHHYDKPGHDEVISIELVNEEEK